MPAIIRAIIDSDRAAWDSLWAGYLAFYKTELTKEQTDLTWSRFLDEDFGLHALVAELDGVLVGFAHFSFTHSTWASSQDLYLEDLYVSPSVRGQGLGKTLIFRLTEIAREVGSRKVWWETQAHNDVARRLYDSVGELSEFVKYTRSVE